MWTFNVYSRKVVVKRSWDVVITAGPTGITALHRNDAGRYCCSHQNNNQQE